MKRAEAFEKLKKLLSSRRRRGILLRHLFPLAFLLLLVLLSLLPVISFRTVEGTSDAHSLIYWHSANFFGADGARGAYALFRLYDADHSYYGFYRAVVILCIADAVCAVVGTCLLIALSVAALYLLLSGETGERSRRVGRVFRLLTGNRWTVLLPCVLMLVPLLFPRLFAYFSTTLRGYATATQFLGLDPLFIALIFLVPLVVLLLSTRKEERESDLNIYLPPHLRQGARDDVREREAEEEWEEAVRLDAETVSDRDAAGNECSSSHDAPTDG